jgi:hypothetical protein
MTRRIVVVATLLLASILGSSPSAHALRATAVYAQGWPNDCLFSTCESYFDLTPWAANDPRGLPSLIGVTVHTSGTQDCEAPYWLFREYILTSGRVAGWVFVGQPWDAQFAQVYCNVYQWRLSYLAQNGL